MIGTAKQHSYIKSLARQGGYQSEYYAAAKHSDSSISRIQRKGLSSAEASAVIDALLHEQAVSA